MDGIIRRLKQPPRDVLTLEHPWRLRTATIEIHALFVWLADILDDYESGIACPYLGRKLDGLQLGREAVFRYQTGNVSEFLVAQG